MKGVDEERKVKAQVAMKKSGLGSTLTSTSAF
jgi:hypothetical protein